MCELTPTWSLGINATGLIDFLQQEEGLRFSIERRIFNNSVGLLVEPGFYFEGSGNNLKIEIKDYHINILKGEDRYLGLAYFRKSHTYSPDEISYTDSTHSTIAANSVKVFVIKNVTTLDVIMGSQMIQPGKRLLLDWYVGIGARFKNISGISMNAYNMMEDNIGRNGLQPGLYAWPDLTAGIRVGLCFYKKEQGDSNW